MTRISLFLIGMLIVFPAAGQAIKLACASPASCQFITDPFDLTGPQPTTCKLYKAGSTTPIQTASVLTATVVIPTAPPGSVLCSFNATFQIGSYSLTAVASRSGFSDSAPSLPYVFDSVAPAPVQTPINLHPRNAVIVP